MKPTPSDNLQNNPHHLRGGMVGMGMIFDETYRPFFEHAHRHGLYDSRFGICRLDLSAVASRTGGRAETYRQSAPAGIRDFQSFTEPNSKAFVDSRTRTVCGAATEPSRYFARIGF